MATYIVGDVQGCFGTLQQLLQRIQFSPGTDHLWLAGDIVNRGPQSAEVLRWVYAMRDHVHVVLGTTTSACWRSPTG